MKCVLTVEYFNFLILQIKKWRKYIFTYFIKNESAMKDNLEKIFYLIEERHILLRVSQLTFLKNMR